MKRFWMATVLMALSITGLYAQTPAAKPAPESVHIRSTKEKAIKERWFTIPEKRMEVRKDTVLSTQAKDSAKRTRSGYGKNLRQ